MRDCPGVYTMPKKKHVIRLVMQAQADNHDPDWAEIARYNQLDPEVCKWLAEAEGLVKAPAKPAGAKTKDPLE